MGAGRLGQRVLSGATPEQSGWILHEKEYLQPFERELARRELAGLGIVVAGFDKHQQTYRVKGNDCSDLPRRLSRLAYFDWVCAEGFRPTLQAQREGAPPEAASARDLPRRRVLRFGPHDLHEYRGKFFPQLVRSLCNASSLPEGARVLDPMCGSGTTPAESRALDLHAMGLDRNPLSVLIASVKTDCIGWSRNRVRDAAAQLRTAAVDGSSARAEHPWEEPDRDYLAGWFDPQALDDIASLLGAVNRIEDEGIRRLGLVCLSDVLRDVSHQSPDDLRVRKLPRPYRREAAVQGYLERVMKNLGALERLVAADPGHAADFTIRQGDARTPHAHLPEHMGTIDAVITSPPYATALPYLDTDRLSLVALGLLPRKRHRDAEADMIGTREVTERARREAWERYETQRETLPDTVQAQIDSIAEAYHQDGVGFRRRNLPALLARYFLDMREALAGMQKMLRPEAPAFVVVGNNSTVVEGKRVEIQTDRLLTDVAEAVGLRVEPPVDMELLASRDIFRKNRGSREQILHLVNS